MEKLKHSAGLAAAHEDYQEEEEENSFFFSPRPGGAPAPAKPEDREGVASVTLPASAPKKKRGFVERVKRFVLGARSDGPVNLKKRWKRRRINRKVESHLKRRRQKNTLFTFLCAAALWSNVALLGGMAAGLIYVGAGAMTYYRLTLPVPAEAKDGERAPLYRAFAEEAERRGVRISSRDARAFFGQGSAAEAKPENGKLAVALSPEAVEALNHPEATAASRLPQGAGALLAKLQDEGALERVWNSDFWTRSDSNHPELAGVLAGVIGMAGTALICMLIAFPLGTAAAVYLEEFAPKGKFSDFLEVNINNLASVPSVVFGLLGVSLYIGHLGLPRSSLLAGGLTLSMMALPVIVIAARSALRAVPQSVRDGALALGATHMQAMLHHVLPMATPGMITGLTLGAARVLGETAPLVLIGMVAFVSVPPDSLTAPATTLPVQIFMWSDRPEAGFREKTAAATALLLLILFAVNFTANMLRRKYTFRR